MKEISKSWRLITEKWPGLTLYQRFESVVALIITIVITVVIAVALYRLIAHVISILMFSALNPLDQKVFQSIFGEILTLLIALEFNHTLQYAVSREQSIIQTKIVLLISILALARKFIILDLNEISANQLLGLAAVTLTLGIIYWLMRERDDRLQEKMVQPRLAIRSDEPHHRDINQ
jgi:uncharacterized membrane protein (DUF373 family)